MSSDLLASLTNIAGWMPGVQGFAAVGFSTNLAIVAFAAWVIGFLIGRTYLNNSIAYLLITVKIVIPLSYFAIWADGSWYTGGDDWGYVIRAIDLHLKDVDPIRIWFVAEGQHLFQFPNGALVKWYNSALFFFFGPSYYAGVMFAPVLSMIGGGVIFALLGNLGKSRNYAKWAAIFFLLHWETITWTSFLNLKEPLITLLLIVFVYGLVSVREKSILSLAAIAFTTVVFQKARFYLPFVLFSGYLMALSTYALAINYRKRILVGSISIIGTVIALIFLDVISTTQIRYAFSLADFSNWGSGLAKVVLSPLPWNISEPAGYLLISSILHLIFLPVTLLGGILLWRTGLSGRILVCVYVIGLVAYALQPMVNSPRHRSPFMAMEILMQFEFLYWVTTGGLSAWLSDQRKRRGKNSIDGLRSN